MNEDMQDHAVAKTTMFLPSFLCPLHFFVPCATQVWRDVKVFVRERMAEQAKETNDATIATKNGFDLHLAQVHH